MKWVLLLATLFFAGLLVSCGGKSAAPPTTTTSGTVSFDWDKGPIEIDAQVAKYPKEMQDTYNNVLKVKCNQCHPLSRALWSPYFDEALFTKIVNKMGHRAGSQVTDDEIPKVIKFLVYDHTQRKAEIEKMFTDNHWEKKDPVL